MNKNKMAKDYHFFISLVLFVIMLIASPAKAQEQGIIINEFSNGTSGTKEYIEFLVVGCSGSRVDIRGWKFDDNNGDFSNGAINTGQGIASGHSRFSMDANWSSVPVGSLILVYNSTDKNPKIALSDDPTDSNVDSVYILSHAYSAYIETCNADPYASSATSYDNTYTTCTTFGSGSWTTVGMRNAGDASQVRKPDGTYFHGFGYGDNTGGPDGLSFPGDGTSKVYSYTSSSCNYRNITNFTAQAAPTFETPGTPNNPSNLDYIKFLREGITPGTISAGQIICSGNIPSTLTESGAVVRCYVNYQWQSSLTNTVGSFHDIIGAISSSYSPPAQTVTTYFRRVVTNICQHDTSNIITIAIIPALAKPDQPLTTPTTICINPANSTVTTNAVTGALGYNWEIYPAAAGVITGTTTAVTVDWNDTYTGVAKLLVKAFDNCGQGPPSDTTEVTILNTQIGAGPDQLSACGTSTILAANVGTGTWSILSGSGGSFSNTSLYNATFSGVQGQVYILEWTAGSSVCTGTGTDDVKILFNPVPAAPIAKDTSRCGNGSLTLTATGGTNGAYQWYTSTNGTPLVNELNNNYTTPTLSQTTNFYVSINNGTCESPKTLVKAIISNPAPANAGQDINLFGTNTASLAGTGEGSFSWTPSSSLNNATISNPTATPTQTTTYALTVVSAEGCISHDSVTVFVLCDQVFIPNLITPNEDGRNDVFDIGCTQSLNWNLEILNRWGETVYKSSNYQNEWKADGLGNGVYYYFLNSDVLKATYKGWIQVLN